MTVDALVEHYYSFAMQGDTLIPFTVEVLGGAYGPVPADVILEFLDRMELLIVGNIEDHYQEAPGLEVDVDRVREDTRREVDRARALVLEHQ